MVGQMEVLIELRRSIYRFQKAEMTYFHRLEVRRLVVYLVGIVHLTEDWAFPSGVGAGS